MSWFWSFSVSRAWLLRLSFRMLYLNLTDPLAGLSFRLRKGRFYTLRPFVLLVLRFDPSSSMSLLILPVCQRKNQGQVLIGFHLFSFCFTLFLYRVRSESRSNWTYSLFDSMNTNSFIICIWFFTWFILHCFIYT